MLGSGSGPETLPSATGILLSKPFAGPLASILATFPQSLNQI
jgi:hypothetical protein